MVGNLFDELGQSIASGAQAVGDRVVDALGGWLDNLFGKLRDMEPSRNVFTGLGDSIRAKVSSITPSSTSDISPSPSPMMKVGNSIEGPALVKAIEAPVITAGLTPETLSKIAGISAAFGSKITGAMDYYPAEEVSVAYNLPSKQNAPSQGFGGFSLA